MRPWYADDYRGWPVAPRNRQHPVRGSWLDPRRKEIYHPGIDISVRDDRPERGHPPGRTHRVYALEGGLVWRIMSRRSPLRRASSGSATSRTVTSCRSSSSAGSPTRPADRLDHQHRVAPAPERVALPGGDPEPKPPDPGEPARPGRQDRAVSRHSTPGHPGDPFPPAGGFGLGTRHGSAVFSPGGALLDPSRLAGLVDVRARIEDLQSFRGWWRDVPLLETDHHPARVHLAVDRATDGKRVIDRDVFPSGVWPARGFSPESDLDLPPLRAGHAAKPPRRHRVRPETPGPRRALVPPLRRPPPEELLLGHHGLPRRPLPADRDRLGHRREPHGRVDRRLIANNV